MRDPTKWLVALVPGAGLVLILAHLVPKLAATNNASPEFLWALVFSSVAVLAAMFIVVLATAVLRVEFAGWGDAVREAGRQQTAGRSLPPGPGTLAFDLDRNGVLRLYGYSAAEQLFEEMATTRVPSPRAAAAGQLIVDFAAFRSIRAAFLRFLGYGALAFSLAVLALAATEYALARAEAPPLPVRVTSPTQVRLHLSDEGVRAIESALSCKLENSFTGWAIGGSLAEPLLVIDGAPPSCPVKSILWLRSWGEIVPVAK